MKKKKSWCSNDHNDKWGEREREGEMILVAWGKYHKGGSFNNIEVEEKDVLDGKLLCTPGVL